MNADNVKIRRVIDAGGQQSAPQVAVIGPSELGSARLSPEGEFVAGSLQTLELIYSAGKYGIDDSGSLRVCFRFASDQSRPQFDDPKGVGYTTVTASNDAVLQCRYDPKGNVRPWDRTVYIKVVHGFLREGDTITMRFGDPAAGSPGLRLQTFCEDSFEFHVLVDPIATYNYQPLLVQPVVRIVPGEPHRWVTLMPTQRRVNQTFTLFIKAEDRWGNPTNRVDTELGLHANVPVLGLPESIRIAPGKFVHRIDGLSVASAADVFIELGDDKSGDVASGSAMRVVDDAALLPYWVDLHGQSEETIGTNSARHYFEFARDYACLDATGHQANDFQITNSFWSQLDSLSAEFNEADRFVTLPGYEWSGNTSLGGDRNVYYTQEGRPIRRSSHALVPDKADLHSDASSAAELFKAFADSGEDVVCFAHCGGRYADIAMAHDGRFEHSVEIHSSWGTFEWLLHDAFKLGYRVGNVANSDGHKGRPGASYPGASLFGAIGGLTCLLLPTLNRQAVIDALRARRHYATSGGRLMLDVRAEFVQGGRCYRDDPALGDAVGRAESSAMMGDIVQLLSDNVQLRVDIVSAAPIERVEVHTGMQLIETIRPYSVDELGDRIRVVWEGAEYRGRFRQVVWDGYATLSGNHITDARPINFFNADKPLERVNDTGLRWRALTTGNFGGFDMWLDDAYAGTLKLETPIIKFGIPIEEIGFEDEIIDRSGQLPRFVRIFRMPTQNPYRSMSIEREIEIHATGDNPIFVKVVQEDGHIAWSSPIYFYR
ncbi:MAG: DUF3604 domain-containing protein [Gammaproteobacteria bacterium]|nr:DUF3604 domain-containing protein [Gammaproteobacteria bacterium]MDH3465383.1 DUF3604 domain-containing protein [Gammaproteobacteria bacterium]